jgi:hypothetical protein
VSAPRPQPQIAAAYHLAVERNFTAYQTVALIALAELARHGVVTASLPAIAHEARQSRREVYNSVHFLADQELVEIVNHPGLATEYRISFGSYEKSPGDEEPVHDVHPPVDEPVHDVHHPSAQHALPDAQRALPQEDDPCTACTTTSAHRAPPLYSLISLSKEEREEEERAPPTPQAGRAVARARWTGEHQIVWDAWNAMARTTGLAPARAQSPQRQRDLTKRLATYGLAEVLEAIDRVGRSAFCHGSGPRGWRADFPWLLQTDSVERTNAGRYDNHTPPDPWAKYRHPFDPPAASGDDGYDGTTIDGEAEHATYTH